MAHTAHVHFLTGPRQPAMGAGDRILVSPVANGAHDGSIRVDVHGKIFKFRISQPSTHATLNYAGRVTVNGQSMEKMDALALKMKTMFERVFTRESVQNVRAINFHLHRENERSDFSLQSFSTRANDSDQFVDYWFPGIQNGDGLRNRIVNHFEFGTARDEMATLFTECERDRIAEARQRKNNPPPAPQPQPQPGAQPAPARRKKAGKPKVGLDLNKLAPLNDEQRERLKGPGYRQNKRRHSYSGRVSV